MAESKMDLILHPIRLRIIQRLASGKPMTPGDLNQELPDVPQASLYRHLNTLVKGGLVQVVKQRQVRGAVEKIYTLATEVAMITPEDLAQATKEDHFRYFTTFLVKLLGDFERYLEHGDVNLIRDGVGFRQVELNLNDSEFMMFMKKIGQVVLEFSGNEATADRIPRVLTSILIPNRDGIQGKGNK